MVWQSRRRQSLQQPQGQHTGRGAALSTRRGRRSCRRSCHGRPRASGVLPEDLADALKSVRRGQRQRKKEKRKATKLASAAAAVAADGRAGPVLGTQKPDTTNLQVGSVQPATPTVAEVRFAPPDEVMCASRQAGLSMQGSQASLSEWRSQSSTEGLERMMAVSRQLRGHDPNSQPQRAEKTKQIEVDNAPKPPTKPGRHRAAPSRAASDLAHDSSLQPNVVTPACARKSRAQNLRHWHLIAGDRHNVAPTCVDGLPDDVV